MELSVDLVFPSFAHSYMISAAISFTKDKLDLKADGLFGKNNIDFLNENETTISVSWSGGGQHLKPCMCSLTSGFPFSGILNINFSFSAP